MNKHFLTKLIALVFAGCFHTAQAAIPLVQTAALTVQLPGATPFNYTTTVGSSFDAGIYINSVSDFAYFDLNVTYDSTKLSALSFTSASIFGAADTQAMPTTITTQAGVGTVHFNETISGTSPLTAGLNIAVPTLLATVHFQALQTGVNSIVTVTNPVLSDFAAGLTGVSIGSTVQGAFATINPAPAPAAVPLPASALLFAPGLLAVFGLRKPKARASAA